MQLLPLDPNLRSVESQALDDGLRQRIVGQNDAVQAVVDLYQVSRARMNSPRRPLGNLLFLGPTGAGKTRVVEAAAEVLFGNSRAMIKVDCAEFQHSHEIAKLIGSPPGYIGHRETQPLITQEALNQHHSETTKISFLLFDEIEKASEALWQLLLGMLDKATLTLVQRDDLHDVQPRWKRNRGTYDRPIGFCSLRTDWAPICNEREGRPDRVGSCETQVCARIHKPHR